MAKIPVLIDVDTGIDDAIALVLALASDKLDVKGITTVAGNVTLDRTTENTLAVVELLKRTDVPVAKGADRPLVRPVHTAPEVHGNTGLGNATLPKATLPLNEKDAVSFMAQVIEESEVPVTLMPVGPLTNIAIFLMSYPHLKPKIKEIVIMGGAAYGGNVTPSSEFNIYVDPHAAHVVFSSGIKIVMCGLDVTLKAYATQRDIESFANLGNDVGAFCAKTMETYLARYLSNGQPGCALHDAVAVTYLIAPELLGGRNANVQVDIDGEHTFACTVTDFRLRRRNTENENAFVVLDVEREKFIDLLLKAAKSY